MFDAYVITNATMTDRASTRTYNPLIEFLNETTKISTYSEYIHTTLDLDCFTLAHAMKKKMYYDNECWINYIIDFHGSKFSRDQIFNTIGKTNDDVQKGLSVQDIAVFFERNNLQLRVYDAMYVLLVISIILRSVITIIKLCM